MPIPKRDLKKVGLDTWEISKGYRPGMRVPVRIFASEAMLEEFTRDRSLDQLVNVSMLPGIVGEAVGMPDIHEGYGCPVGGVFATEWPDGIVSPGAIGYDLNCGVRLLLSMAKREQILPKLGELTKALYKAVPSGVGRGGQIRLSEPEINEVLRDGVAWAIRKGFGQKDDPEFLEEGGSMAGADPAKVSHRAKKRGHDQIGTLGSGNHFLEIGVIAEIYDQEAARAFGLELEQVSLLIHCGSRGLGHQICTDYVALALAAAKKYGISLPDRELACVPASSEEGRDYLAAMRCALNFAWTNRQLITHWSRKVWREVLSQTISDPSLRILYDVAHNIGKVEEHTIAGRLITVLVHRKGATRAFPAGRSEVSLPYRQVGQPVLIPGSMGTASYVLVGRPRAMELSFGTSAHGAGRKMSRAEAKRRVRGDLLRKELERRGILVECDSLPGIAEEAPEAYKSVDEVVEVTHRVGISGKVARLQPLGVVKGG